MSIRYRVDVRVSSPLAGELFTASVGGPTLAQTILKAILMAAPHAELEETILEVTRVGRHCPVCRGYHDIDDEDNLLQKGAGNN